MSEKMKTEGTRLVEPKTGQPANSSRRKFLANTGMYTAGLMGSAVLGACSDTASIADQNDNDNDNSQPNSEFLQTVNVVSDAAILNFALNLEYLEAQYYLLAVTGEGLKPKDTGDNPGRVIKPGNTKVDFDTKLIQQYANEIAADELHHVQFLRKALGNSAADQPQLDLKNSFAALGNLIGAPNFNPFANEQNFLLGAFIFEDVGVTAYHGGSPFIKNRQYLDAAAGILAVEAYHAGLLRTVLTAQNSDNVTNLVNQISGVRDQVDGDQDIDADYPNGQPPIQADDDQGISRRMVDIYGNNYNATNIVPTNQNGIAFNRSIARVNNVVYATPQKASSGGFFPNGTNIPGNKGLSISADNT